MELYILFPGMFRGEIYTKICCQYSIRLFLNLPVFQLYVITHFSLSSISLVSFGNRGQLYLGFL